MLEEAYEAVDAINSGDMKHLKEELGDLLLQIVIACQRFISTRQIAFIVAMKKLHFQVVQVPLLLVTM